MNITSIKALRYAGKAIPAGQDFEATPRDAKILVAIKRAAYIEQPTVEAEDHPPEVQMRVKRKYQRRDMVPAKPKRKYQRRVMQAEG